MIECKNDHIDPIMPTESILDRLEDKFLQACVKSVHFAKTAELDAIKWEAEACGLITDLSDRLKCLRDTEHKLSIDADYFTKKAE